MKIIKKLLLKKIILYKWQFHFFGSVMFALGVAFAIYFLGSLTLHTIFATSGSWNQTDWSGGEGGSTTDQYSAGSNIDGATVPGTLKLSQTSNWFNSSWKYRRKITFDNRTSNLGTTSEALTDFPVLVQLTSSNIDYSQVQDAGQDLRFADSSAPTTALSYEIEKWDETGTSYVWVKIPSIDIDSNTDYIYMYYGNGAASDAQSPSSVWNSNYKAVWHLKESSGTLLSDSSIGAFNSTKLNSTHPNPLSSGQFGGAQSYAADSYSTHTKITLSSGLTYEGWVKTTSTSTTTGVTYIANTILSDNTGTIYNLFGIHGGKVRYNQYVSSWSSPVDGATSVNNDSWHYVAVTHNSSTGAIVIYVDGITDGTGTRAYQPSYDGVNTIGAAYSNENKYDGSLDEIRLSDTVRTPAWMAATYKTGKDLFNTYSSQETYYATPGVLTSNIYDTAQLSAWGSLTYASSGTGTISVKVRAGNSPDLSDATSFSSCSAVTSGTDLSGGCTPDGKQYLQYQITLTSAEGATTPLFTDINIDYSAFDTTPPITNASGQAMYVSSGGRQISSGNWNNSATPYFTWTTGADDGGGSGLKGYCLYLGTDSGGNPATAKGILGTSPISTTGATCQFIVSSTSIDLSSSGYLATGLVAGTTYYMNIKAIDNANNVYAGSSATFNFQHDATIPTNVAYISTPSNSFSNVVDMNFSWPISGSSAASDADSGVLGYQYQINSTSGTWLGTNSSTACGFSYIPSATAAYMLTALQDENSIQTGTNIVYFRAVDSACSSSSTATYRTGNLSFGGTAPTFDASCNTDTGVTISPSSSTSNSFALSWNTATASPGRTVSGYYYMINTSPPSSLATITSNTSTYIANSTATSVAAGVLTGSIRGANTVYVVAADDQNNYSPSNCIKGTYTLNSTNPDPPINVSASDASIKASSLWRTSLGWGTPAYAGTGSLTYKIQRSTDNSSWTTVTTTTGSSYIDTVSDSKKYYWRIGSYDSSSQSQADPSYATSVSLTPKGTYTEAPSLASGPTVSSITTKKAKITWSTSRSADSKVQYGTSASSYFDEEPSNSSQTTDHNINLTNLSPGTTYYYKVKWTDEDGNTASSSEKNFSTDSAPTVTDPKTKTIGLTSGIIEYTVTGASKVKFYYGKTTAFGFTKEVSTSSSATTYTTSLEDLEDGTKYYYKINTFDSEGSEYEGNTLSFETLPRPKLSNIRLQEIKGSAQPAMLVTWTSNTEVSSIITYYPDGAAAKAHDEINITLKKGEHKMVIKSLLAQTNYILVVKGRDKAGNEALSDSQRFTTSTDTRPPQISNLKTEGSSLQSTTSDSPSTSQLVISWDTDELANSQVEFGEGTGNTYSQKTQEDINFTTNHVVIISNLTPSKVYHLRALSKDKANNTGKSIDTVTITPQSTSSALDLVIGNLGEAFKFLNTK